MDGTNWNYSDKVKEHFFHPKNILDIDEKEYNADGMGYVGSPACGDMMKIFIKVKDDKIVDLKWQTFGCASAIGSTSMLSEMVIRDGGMMIDEAWKLTPEMIINELGGLPANKIHCSVLGDKALREAIKDHFKRTGQEHRIPDDDKSRVICECLNVTEDDIRMEVLEGVKDFKTLQERTKLGTMCGKCIDTAKTLVDFYVGRYYTDEIYTGDKKVGDNMIYMDNSATTPLHPRVKEAISNALDLFGNPSSMHSTGRQVRAMLEESRKDIADFFNCEPDELIFTAGASEANNTVLKSSTTCCAMCNENHGHIITSNIEHPSVQSTLKCLSQNHVNVTEIKVNTEGIIDPKDVEAAIRPDTMMISIMYVNNEIGTIQPIKEIAEIAKKHNIPMHTDAVQAVGKLPIDLKELPVDFLSMSGHKIYAPKGIGILFKRKSAKNICPLITGGHQENSMRAGTENTLGIIALGEAMRQAKLEMEENKERIGKLRDKLEQGIMNNLDKVKVNGDPNKRVYNITNLSFTNIEGESILLRLDMHGIAVSTGSACSTGNLEPSYVITALEVEPEIAHSSIRFSLGRETTEEDVDRTIEAVTETITFLRKISPIA